MVGGSEVNSLLKYRYTKPQPGDYAQVRMHINNILVDSINANGDATRGQMQLRLPGFEGYLVDSLKNGYAFSAQNDLSFSVAYTHTFSEGSADNCKSAVLLPHQLEAILINYSIDLKQINLFSILLGFVLANIEIIVCGFYFSYLMNITNNFAIFAVVIAALRMFLYALIICSGHYKKIKSLICKIIN